jgi:transposase
VKQKRFSVEQIVAVLKQSEAGVPLAELLRRVGVSEQTFYRWKKQYVGLNNLTVSVLLLSSFLWSPHSPKYFRRRNSCGRRKKRGTSLIAVLAPFVNSRW